MSISVTTRSPLIQRTAVVATAAGALLLLPSATAPAFGRPDPGPRTVTPVEPSVHDCLLRRAGTQYVRCDDLTGNGVPAPTWVHQY